MAFKWLLGISCLVLALFRIGISLPPVTLVIVHGVLG